METDRIAPAQAANETTPNASDRMPSKAPKGDAITRAAAQRGLNQRPILGAGLLALMALSAGAYFYWAWDASQEIANRPPASSPSAAPRVAENPARPSSSPAPTATPAPVAAPAATPASTATPAPATLPASPAIAAAPKSSGPPSEPTARKAPATTQAPINMAPVAAEPAPTASLQQQPASLPKEDVVFVQKPGVRMRSEPGRRGKVIGAPPRGSQFKIVGRAGSWVQVEGDAGRGWIGSRMLGPQSP